MMTKFLAGPGRPASSKMPPQRAAAAYQQRRAPARALSPTQQLNEIDNYNERRQRIHNAEPTRALSPQYQLNKTGGGVQSTRLPNAYAVTKQQQHHDQNRNHHPRNTKPSYKLPSIRNTTPIQRPGTNRAYTEPTRAQGAGQLIIPQHRAWGRTTPLFAGQLYPRARSRGKDRGSGQGTAEDHKGCHNRSKNKELRKESNKKSTNNNQNTNLTEQ